MAEKPLRIIKAKGHVLEVDTESPLQVLTGFYPGIVLIAWPSGSVTVEDIHGREGIAKYVAAKQAALWMEMCGPEKKRKEPL